MLLPAAAALMGGIRVALARASRDIINSGLLNVLYLVPTKVSSPDSIAVMASLHMCVDLILSLYIYIYIYIETLCIYIYIYTYTHTHTHFL